MIAVALSVSIALIAVGIGKGIQREIKEKLATYNGHIQVLNYSNKNGLITLPIPKDQPFYPKDPHNDSTFQNVRNVSVFGYASGILWGEDNFETLIYKGLGPDYHWDRFRPFLKRGVIPVLASRGYNDSILISENIARKLLLDVGSEVKMMFIKQGKKARLRKFFIAGIFDASFKEFDNNFIIGDLNHVRKINHWSKDQVGGFEIWVDDWSVLAQASSEIYRRVGIRLNTRTILEKHPQIVDWISLFDANIVMIISVMMLIAVINICAVLLSLILERVRLVGLLKSLGSSNTSVRKVFILSASKILIRGIFWGNVIGCSLLFLQNNFKIIRLDPNYYYVPYVPVYFHVPYFLLVNALCIFCSVLALLGPSYIITRISPAKTLRM